MVVVGGGGGGGGWWWWWVVVVVGDGGGGWVVVVVVVVGVWRFLEITIFVGKMGAINKLTQGMEEIRPILR